MPLLTQRSELDHLSMATVHHALRDEPSQRKHQERCQTNLPTQGENNPNQSKCLHHLRNGWQQLGGNINSANLSTIVQNAVVESTTFHLMNGREGEMKHLLKHF